MHLTLVPNPPSETPLDRALARLANVPKFARGLSLVTWVYNEELLIGDFVARIDGLLSRVANDYEIIVVDDGSTDRTVAILGEIERKMPRLRVIHNPSNLGIGLSSRNAIQAATKEFLFWQTIDWSYDISLLRLYLELLKTHDVVAGVRRAPVATRGWLSRPAGLFLRLFSIQHITRRSDTVPKALVSVLNYLLIRMLFRLPLSDYQNVVFYRTCVIQAMGLVGRSSFANPEALLKAHSQGCSIVEVPISFIPRQAGEAKGTRFKSLVASVRDIFAFWVKWLRRPRKFRSPGKISRLDPALWTPQGITELVNRVEREGRATPTASSSPAP